MDCRLAQTVAVNCSVGHTDILWDTQTFVDYIRAKNPCFRVLWGCGTAHDRPSLADIQKRFVAVAKKVGTTRLSLSLFWLH